MSATASASGASLAPNSVLYFQNLDEKVKKAPLRQALLHACAPFGQVKAVHALKTNKMRGQAFVYFGDAAEAALALRDLQGQQLFTKPMVRVMLRSSGVPRARCRAPPPPPLSPFARAVPVAPACASHRIRSALCAGGHSSNSRLLSPPPPTACCAEGGICAAQG